MCYGNRFFWQYGKNCDQFYVCPSTESRWGFLPKGFHLRHPGRGLGYCEVLGIQIAPLVEQTETKLILVMFSYFEILHPSQVPGDEKVAGVECEDPDNEGKLGPCTRETPKSSIILFKTFKSNSLVVHESVQDVLQQAFNPIYITSGFKQISSCSKYANPIHWWSAYITYLNKPCVSTCDNHGDADYNWCRFYFKDRLYTI